MLLNRPRFALLGLALIPGWLLAQSATPAGLWETYDDHTGQAASHVRVVDSANALSGTIDRILDPAKAAARCEVCEGELKDQPIAGMMIFHDVKLRTDDALTWDGGDILDPKSGKVYKVRIKLIDDGKTLEVRGYKGSPMFGRTQLWRRVPELAAAPAAASTAAASASALP